MIAWVRVPYLYSFLFFQLKLSLFFLQNFILRLKVQLSGKQPEEKSKHIVKLSVLSNVCLKNVPCLNSYLYF